MVNKPKPSVEDLAKKWGFKDAVEMERIIMSINLIEREKWTAFIKWAMEDKSKVGLIRDVLGGEEFIPPED